MNINGWHIITMDTLSGPWHVSSKGKFWYIINILTYTTKRIGSFRCSGINYFDRAQDIADERNKVFLKKRKHDLPLYMGRYPEFDKTIAQVLQEQVPTTDFALVTLRSYAYHIRKEGAAVWHDLNL